MNKLQTLSNYLRRGISLTRPGGAGQTGKFQSVTGYTTGQQQPRQHIPGLTLAQQRQEAEQWRRAAYNEARQEAWQEYQMQRESHEAYRGAGEEASYEGGHSEEEEG